MTITVTGGNRIISSLRRLSDGLSDATKNVLDSSLQTGVILNLPKQFLHWTLYFLDHPRR